MSWLAGWMDVVYGCAVDEYFDGDLELLDNNFEDIDIYEVGGTPCMQRACSLGWKANCFNLSKSESESDIK